MCHKETKQHKFYFLNLMFSHTYVQYMYTYRHMYCILGLSEFETKGTKNYYFTIYHELRKYLCCIKFTFDIKMGEKYVIDY